MDDAANPLARVMLRWWLGMQAAVALTLGAHAGARGLYERIVRLYPADARALASVGNLRMQAGDSAGAVDAFADLVRRNPDHADAWFNLGYVHEKRGELAPAERCMREAIRVNPKHDRAWYGLALALIRRAQLGEAVGALQTNIALQPMSPYGYYQLGMTLHHLGRSDEAARIGERLRQFEPKYARTLDRDIANTTPICRLQPGPAGAEGMAVVEHPKPSEGRT
jgi:tetratricopeptide (TPR) repeat protein